MSHGIILPIDRLYSVQNSEWHGLATVVPSIDQAEFDSLSPRIIEGKASFVVDEKTYIMPNHKVLAADYRVCRPDLVGTEHEIVPLHIPKNSYRPIENGEMFAALRAALEGIDGATVSCAGTLEAGKKAFASVSIGSTLRVKTKYKNEEIMANLNFVTSHDGTLGLRAYDSTVRIVCMNTLRWSLQAQGEVGFAVYHTEGADFRMKNLASFVNAILNGRGDFVTAMEHLAKVDVTHDEMRHIIKGYFLSKGDSDELATRSLNACEEIQRLAIKGKGNNGETLYDLANGATEYWTSGEGTGKKSGLAERKYKSEFGAAADHKTAFVFGLLDDERRGEWQKAGKDLERVLVAA